MADSNRDDLLRPVLGDNHGAPVAMYSATTGYMASFFGGPIGGAIVALVNSQRLNRLGADWWVAVVALASTSLLLYWELRLGGAEWLEAKVGGGAERLLLRAMGIAFFGLIYLLHRRYYRNMTLLGVQPAPGWVVGIVAIVLGVISMAVIAGTLAA